MKTIGLDCCVEYRLANHELRATVQVDRDEVRLRRTIGLKKDEFTLDRKHITCAHCPAAVPALREHVEANTQDMT